jgi:hypothetical protein
MVMMMMMMMMVTMMSRRRRRGYLRTVTFESVYKTPPLVTVQQYFCTLSTVQAATQHVKSTL